ncbi:unnamed protein product, partial [Rangifer tarandus platyrhynchus]
VNVSPYALPICPLTFLSIYACLSVCLSIYHLSNYLSIQSTHLASQPAILCMYLHVHPICLSSIFYLSIYLSTYLSFIYQSSIFIYLSTYLSIQSICPTIHSSSIYIYFTVHPIYLSSIYLS